MEIKEFHDPLVLLNVTWRISDLGIGNYADVGMWNDICKTVLSQYFQTGEKAQGSEILRHQALSLTSYMNLGQVIAPSKFQIPLS